LLESQSIASTKTNTTSNSVTYGFSGSHEDFPLGTLSNIYVTVRNSHQTAFTQLSDSLSLTVYSCDVSASTLLCATDTPSLTMWTGQIATVSYNFSWD